MRFQPPFYETPEKGTHDESEVAKPDGMQAVIWHDALRIVASIPESVMRTCVMLLSKKYLFDYIC